MLFGLFGKKDHRHYLTRGGKHLAAERYADARIDFEEALNLCPADAQQDEREIRDGLSAARNGLATLNLQEGEHAVNAGDLEKAAGHFTLAGELAIDDALKGRAREALKRLNQPAAAAAAPARSEAPAAAGPYGGYATANSTATTQSAESARSNSGHAHSHGGGCGGSCSSGGTRTEVIGDDGSGQLSDDDQFQLLVHPLPGDLSARYSALGDKFKRAYLHIHDGNDAKALPILQEMLLSCENDIVIYEVALIMYRSKRIHECDSLLKRSIEINPTNAMSFVALVHLLAETGRLSEALATVQRMMETGVAADQALFMQGELYQAAGDENNAIESWSKALAVPTVARAAAERLVPLLDAQGRQQEAKFLAKKYLKGCC